MLQAGVGRTDITPPIPIDLVGYSRRWQPATAVRAPLTTTALVVDDGTTRVAIIAIDLPVLRPDDATRWRRAVAEAIDTNPDHVLINLSHTHAGPTSHIGGVKIGGDQRGHSPVEVAYIALLPHQVVAAARLAIDALTPAMVGAAVGSSDLAVNRRERTEDGRTILGWNPEGPLDRDVGVLSVVRPSGSVLATVVNYACHPVVVGPDDPGVNPDFPGPMRELIERVTGAPALYLQGAAGNVLPLEGFFPASGPEVRFGRRLAVEALHAADRAAPIPMTVEKLDFGSVTPISLYRRVPVDPAPAQRVAVATAVVDLPLKRVPTLEELDAEVATHQAALDAAVAEGADRTRTNPIEYHLNWAEVARGIVASGGATPSVPAFLQAIRIGDIVLVAVPGEVFSEIALAVKEDSPAATTLFCGYSNGIISYLPCAAEYPFGGYEVDYAHHSYGLVEQVAPESEAILVDACRALVATLFT